MSATNPRTRFPSSGFSATAANASSAKRALASTVGIQLSNSPLFKTKTPCFISCSIIRASALRVRHFSPAVVTPCCFSCLSADRNFAFGSSSDTFATGERTIPGPVIACLEAWQRQAKAEEALKKVKDALDR